MIGDKFQRHGSPPTQRVAETRSAPAEAKTVNITVRATAPGFHLGRRRVGEEFGYEARIVGGEPKIPSWMVRVSDEEIAKRKAQAERDAAPKPKRGEKQMTLTEAAKEQGKTSLNMPSTKGTSTLAEGGTQTGADLV